MAQVPFFLVTGYLGSGKTTLLKRFLQAHADGRRLAVVQNEFAPQGVDGAELRRTGKPFHLLEVNRGSIFCVCLLSDFRASLRAMIESVRPDAVLLEATGLADPIALAQLLAASDLRPLIHLSHAWCVADASTFLAMEPRVRRISHQVRIADTVLVNKIDLAPAGSVALVHERIRALNPWAAIHDTTHCDIGLARAFAPLQSPPVAEKHEADFAGLDSGARPDLGTAVLRTTDAISRRGLDEFLESVRPAVHRLKGYAILEGGAAISVQLSFGQLELLPVADYQGATELVAIGPAVEQSAFAEAFRSRTRGG